ncbi:Ig-like domain-containing protein [Thermaurantimonas aggregans]|uniref:Ig-like domain-containing protein n=1 Tax=Thermaurantimonas aggregans TaxID=2173829 RepID=UPI0023F05130|nr:Ig-like domain-containing protein [Thermaurantimonas aggregans]MCX8148122.1 Ig-like domain-containing protein [Thermaurantimonas aggregans]
MRVKISAKYIELLVILSIYIMNYILKLFSIVIFVTSCANIGTILGGDVDKIPPKIVKELPANFITNFSEKKIVLFFDEYLANTNIQNEINISPSLEKKPKVQIRGKSIEILLGEILEKNTTYVISFGKGIADLNENNVLEGYLYVFSTGNHIDSNFITGTVYEGLTNKSAQNCLVGIFSEKNISFDSLIYLRPDYYTKTDSNGNFTIHYLPNKKFHILAFTDRNNDYIFQPESEEAGKYPYLKSSTDSSPVNLYIFPQNPKYKTIAYRLINPYCCFITYQVPFHTVTLNNLSKNQIIHTQKSESLDTLFIYFEKEIRDSTKLFISTNFSSDTITIQKRTISNEKLNLHFVSKPILSIDDSIYIQSNYPIQKIDTSKIFISTIDSIEVKDFRILEKSKDRFEISFPKKVLTKYNILVHPKAFYFNENIFNTDSFKTQIEIKDKEDFGEISIEVTVDTFLTNLFLIFSDKKGKEIHRFKFRQSIEKFHIRDLIPNTYNVSIFWDRNGNEWWDKALLEKNQPAEVKVLYPEDISVRANWEVDVSWKVPLKDALRRFGY